MIHRLLLLILWVSCTIGQIYANTSTSSNQGNVQIIAPKLLYVNKNVVGGDHSGTSWENAMPDLAEALKWAKLNETQFENDSLQIWVAAGTYLPKYLADDLESTHATNITNSFRLVKNVQLYGGFAGGETSLVDRNPLLNKTTISGDYNQDDQFSGAGATMSIANHSDNAVRLMIGIGDLGNARIDGFHLSNNNDANQSITLEGFEVFTANGIYLQDANLVVQQCYFSHLIGDSGTAIYAINSKLTVNRSQFTEVKAAWGVIDVRDESAIIPSPNASIISNNLFANNYAEVYGAGIHFSGLAQGNNGNNVVLNNTIVNCTSNRNYDIGIGISGTHVKVYNTIILSTSQPSLEGIKTITVGSSADIQNCLVQGLTSTTNGNQNASGLTYEEIFVAPSTGNYAIRHDGKAFDKGNNALYPQLASAVDLLGKPRLVGETIDLGAIESEEVALPFTIRLATDSGSSPTDNITNSNTPTYTGTTAPLATVSVSVNGLTYQANADLEGNWSITATNALPDGTHAVAVSASKVGFVFIPLPDLSITIDTTQPIVTGVIEGENYIGSVIITFNEGSGSVNSVPYSSGATYSTLGNSTLVVTDIAGNTTTVTFTISPLVITPSADRVLYVNKNVVGGNRSGDSWENATPELASALAYAKTNASNWTADNKLQIWVAAGTYKPLYSVNNVSSSGQRNNTFLMVPYVSLFGGFNGTETAVEQRNWSSNPTILDGDLNGNDDSTLQGPSMLSHATRQDNAYHVVTYLGIDKSTTHLDGFHIVNGNANSFNNVMTDGMDVRQSMGGGLTAFNSVPAVKNMIFKRNSAYYGGGASVALNGGGVMGYYELTVVNSIIEENHGEYNGSAIYGETGKVTLINSSVMNHTNAPGHMGAAIRVYQNYYTIVNSILLNPIQSLMTHGTWNAVSFTNVSNSIILGNSENNNIDAANVIATDLFEDPTNGNYRLKSGSVAIDAGSNTAYTAAGFSTVDKDLANENRISNLVIDIGPYETPEPCPVIAAPTTTATTQNFCGEVLLSNVAVTPANGTTATWYTEAIGGNFLPSSQYLTAGTYTYYVASTAVGCASDERLAITIQVNDVPSAPSTTDLVYEQNQVAAPLTAIALPGHTLAWYEYYNSTDTIPTPTPSTARMGEEEYYVRQISPAGCMSDYSELRVTVLKARLEVDAKGILYVNKQVAGGNGKGNSWVNAVDELAYAVQYAKLDTTIREIWVAAGTYEPMYDGGTDFYDDEEYNYFTIANLQLYGGFNGTETRREDRNWKLNPTILSGNTDSNRRLVRSSGATKETILDGFTIQGAIGGDGAVLIYDSYARHIINHCIIKDNDIYMAGLVTEYVSNVIVSNTLFEKNKSYYAGALVAYDCDSITIVNSLFIDNEGELSGAIASMSTMSIHNSIFWNNMVNGSSTTTNADILVSSNEIPVVEPTVLNTITQVYGVNNNARTASSLFGVNPLFTDPANGDYSLQPGSPAINAGDNTYYNAALLGTRDLNGVDRLRDTTIDVGAFEVQEGDNPLPLRLVSFKAVGEQATTVLTWQTAEEEQTHSFEVERSHDGKHFTKVGSVTAKGSGGHAYSFNDTRDTYTSVAYYRLRMVDLDGKYTYSQIVSVGQAVSLERSMASVYPNPVQSGAQVTIDVPVPTVVTIYNAIGAPLQRVGVQAGTSPLNISSLPVGVYLIKTDLGQTIKLLIQR